MSSLGTWAWAQRTNGRLRRRDRAELVRQAALAQLSQLPGPWRRAVLGSGTSLVLPKPPDSALARVAQERAQELSTPGLYAHCERTWLFATLFAQRDRVAHDQELLYLTCILHDIGLTDPHNHTEAAAQCFAVEGARAAYRLLRGHGEQEQRALTVAEAITMHLNITVPHSAGGEAHLVNKGAMLDVIGRYANELTPASMREVLERWPREGLAEGLLGPSVAQAQTRPQSRVAFMQSLPKAAERVAANPLDRLSASRA
jgi:HD domain